MNESSTPPVAVFDIDGTLFRSGLYREVIYELIRMQAIDAAILDQFADKEQQWHARAHGNAFREFEQAMANGMDATLPTIRITDFDQAAERVIQQHKDNVYVYTRQLVKSLKQQGYYLLAISGSQVELVEPFAREYGFDNWIGQEYERGDQYFTGRILQKSHTDKHVLLQNVLEQTGYTLDNSIGVGDSAGDIAMLEMVTHPIAFNPEQSLFAHARTQQWEVVLERKNMIYKLQYHDNEYVLAETISH